MGLVNTLTSSGKLRKIASYLGLLTGFTGVSMYWYLHQKVKKTDHFKLATFNFLNHKALLTFMGEPVRIGDVKLSDNENNYITAGKAHMGVSLSGSIKKGHLYWVATRDPNVPTSKWQLDLLHVAIPERPNDRIVVPIKYKTMDLYRKAKMVLPEDTNSLNTSTS